jgi:hypothetical protein
MTVWSIRWRGKGRSDDMEAGWRPFISASFPILSTCSSISIGFFDDRRH